MSEVKEKWGHKRLGKMSLEYDGCIVMDNQVVGKFAPDGYSPDEVNDICKEIVRRWNKCEG